jgi:hypothetical protein
VIVGLLFVDAFALEYQNAITAATVTTIRTVIARAATSTVANQPATGSVRRFRSSSIRARSRALMKGVDAIRSTSDSSMPPARVINFDRWSMDCWGF